MTLLADKTQFDIFRRRFPRRNLLFRLLLALWSIVVDEFMLRPRLWNGTKNDPDRDWTKSNCWVYHTTSFLLNCEQTQHPSGHSFPTRNWWFRLATTERCGCRAFPISDNPLPNSGFFKLLGISYVSWAPRTFGLIHAYATRTKFSKSVFYH